MTEPGHNSGVVDSGRLKAFIERILRLQEEKKAIGDDIADVYAEAAGTGYDKKAMREVVRLMGQDRDKRDAHESIVALYRQTLGIA